MGLLNKSGIGTGNTIQSSHITNIYDALNGTGSYEVVATGSFSGTFAGSITSASFATLAATATTASYIVNAQTASFVTTAQTASYVLNAVTASFAMNAGGGSGINISNSNLTITNDENRVLSHSGTSRLIISKSDDGGSLLELDNTTTTTGRMLYMRSLLNSETNRRSVRAITSAGDNADDAIFNGWANDHIIEFVSGSGIIPQRLKGWSWSYYTLKDYGFGPQGAYQDILLISTSNEATLNGNMRITGSLVVGNGITGSLFGTASFSITASHAITASYIAASSLTQNINITGSLNVSGSVTQTSSSIVVTLPSGSSTQQYGVAIFKYKQFNYNADQTKIYEDDYIRLSYTTSGTDPKLTIKIDPPVGRVQCVSFSTKFPSNTEAIDGITSLATVDIWPDFGLGSDEVLTSYVTAGLDKSYPYYIINWYRTNTTYGGNISCVVHRYGTDL